MTGNNPANVNPREPHLSAAWFDLLCHTALPEGTLTDQIETPTATGNTSLLRLMRQPSTPWKLEALANFYSPIYGPVDHVLPTSEALRQAMHEIRTARHQRTAVLELSPLDPDDDFFSTAQTALNRAGWLTGRYFRFGNWFAPIASNSFANFMAERPSRLRNTLQRSQRKIERLSAVSTTIHTFADHTLAQAISDFVTVYNRSWKQPEPYPDFIPGLCTLAAQRGWLRFGIMRSEGHAIAAQLCLVSGQRAQIVKLAHDPNWKHGSIGTVLTAELMQHVIECDHVTEIDYLIGDDNYKQDWTPQRRERHGLIAFNPGSARGLLEAARHFGGRILRRKLASPTPS